MMHAPASAGAKRSASFDASASIAPGVKRVRQAQKPAQDAAMVYLPDELWLDIFVNADLTPPELANMRLVDTRMNALCRDDVLWRRFVPEAVAPTLPRGTAHVAFASELGLLPSDEQKAVAQAWRGLGEVSFLGRHPNHFAAVQAGLHRRGRCLAHQSAEFRDDAHLVDTAMASHRSAFEYASPRLQRELPRLTRAVQAEPRLWRLVPAHLAQTPAFVCDWGRRLMQRNAFGPALDAFCDVLRDYPAHPVAHHHRVACLFELGDVKGARRALGEAEAFGAVHADRDAELWFVCRPGPHERHHSDAVMRFWPQMHSSLVAHALDRSDVMYPARLTPDEVQGFCDGPYRLKTRLSHALGVLAQRHAHADEVQAAHETYGLSSSWSSGPGVVALSHAYFLLTQQAWPQALEMFCDIARAAPDMLGAYTGQALCHAARDDVGAASRAVQQGVYRALGTAPQSNAVFRGLVAGLCGRTRRLPHLQALRMGLAMQPCRARAYRAMQEAMRDHSPGYEREALESAADAWSHLWRAARS